MTLEAGEKLDLDALEVHAVRLSEEARQMQAISDDLEPLSTYHCVYAGAARTAEKLAADIRALIQAARATTGEEETPVHPLDGKLEGEARQMRGPEAAAFSSAISLKRIADLLDGTTLGVDVSQTVLGRAPRA